LGIRVNQFYFLPRAILFDEGEVLVGKGDGLGVEEPENVSFGEGSL
jgi:hypothetical protein